MEKEKTAHTSEELWKQKSQIPQQEKLEKTMYHGYVAMDQNNKEIMAPPGQLAIEGLSKGNENFDVGQKTYMLQGDAQEIVDFLDRNKDMTFTAKTLGQDGNWGIGKDPDNANLAMSLGTPQPDGPKNHREQLTDSAQKLVGAAFESGIYTGLIDGFMGMEDLAAINLTEHIAQDNSKGPNPHDALFELSDPINGQTKGSPVVDANSLAGKLQRVKNKAQKKIKKTGVEKLPLVGASINKMVADTIGTKINVVINPYLNPNQPGVAHLNLGSPKVTFGEIAQQLREKVLAEKQGKTNQEEIPGDPKEQRTNLQKQTSEKTEKTENKDTNQKSNASQSKEDKKVESGKTEIKSFPLEQMKSVPKKFANRTKSDYDALGEVQKNINAIRTKIENKGKKQSQKNRGGIKR